MTTVSLSTKFQIVIPKEIRESMELESGTRIEMIPYGDKIVLIPLKPLSTLKGLFSGIDTAIIRGKDRV